MSYVLTNSNGNQLDILKNTLRGWKEEPNDLLILTDDGGKIFASKRVLGLHSALFRDICKDIPVQTAMSVPVSSRCLENLLLLIVDGIVQTIDVDPIIKAASLLGINIGNVELGLVDDHLEKHVNKQMVPLVNYESKNISGDMALPTSAPIMPSSQTQHMVQLQCRFCPMSFRREDDLNNHSRMHHIYQANNGHNNHQSLATNLPTASMSYMSTGKGEIGFGGQIVKTELIEQEPSESLAFPCSECPKSYSSSEGLRRHRITHTAEDGKPFGCLVCGKRYSRKDKLSAHMKNVHNQFMNGPKVDESKERFPCDQCDKTFSRKDILQRHARNIHMPVLGHISLSDLETF